MRKVVTDESGTKFEVEARCLEAVSVWPIVAAQARYSEVTVVKGNQADLHIRQLASTIVLSSRGAETLILALREGLDRQARGE